MSEHTEEPGEAGRDAPGGNEAQTSSDDSASESVLINPVTGSPYPTRSRVFLTGLRSAAIVCLELIVIAVFAGLVLWLLGELWVIVLPVVLAIVVTTVLWPPVRWMLERGVPAAAAAATMMIVAVGVVGAVIGLVVPSIVDQAPELAEHAVDGVKKVQDWVQGPPLNVRDEQIQSAVDVITEKLQSSATTIASGVVTGVSAATSVLVTAFTTLVLVFFFLKDGSRLVPWMNRTLGEPAGTHIGELLGRMWGTLGGFVRTQALVSMVDAVFIGAGLFILHVPLAGALTIITFIGGFVPIVGAFVAGALAVLVALVAEGPTIALIVFGIVIAVQQIEGNVLQPWLQGRTMDLHAAVVLLSVALGGSLFGITGAFLAVPLVSCLAVAFRYLFEQIGQAAGEQVAAEDAAAREAAAERKRRWGVRRRAGG